MLIGKGTTVTMNRLPPEETYQLNVSPLVGKFVHGYAADSDTSVYSIDMGLTVWLLFYCPDSN